VFAPTVWRSRSDPRHGRDGLPRERRASTLSRLASVSRRHLRPVRACRHEDARHVNVEGTRNLLSAPWSLFIPISTISVYDDSGDRPSFDEERPTWAQEIAPYPFTKAEAKRLVIVGCAIGLEGCATFPYVHVDNLADAIVLSRRAPLVAQKPLARFSRPSGPMKPEPGYVPSGPAVARPPPGKRRHRSGRGRRARPIGASRSRRRSASSRRRLPRGDTDGSEGAGRRCAPGLCITLMAQRRRERCCATHGDRDEPRWATSASFAPSARSRRAAAIATETASASC